MDTENTGTDESTGTDGPADPRPQPSDQQHPPPPYDPGIKNYTGISAGTLHTLGDLRDARNLAEMIVDTVREGLLILDFELRVQAANESFYRNFAMRPETTVGRLVYDLGNGGWMVPELRELLENILPHRGALNDYELEHDFEGLGPRFLLLNARRLDDHELILLAIEDATERRKSERALAALNEALEARVEERTLQVRELSRAEHEERLRIEYVLHEDLQQLIFGARLASESGDAAQLRDILGQAMELARSLSHELSLPLLEGKDLSDLLRWVAERSRRLYGLAVELEVMDCCDTLADPALGLLLYEVVRELLFDVFGHAGKEGVRVTADGDDGHIWISVEDGGAGFDPAMREGESGLGLASVRERVERVGGSLQVTTAAGSGNRVTLRVPTRKE